MGNKRGEWHTLRARAATAHPPPPPPLTPPPTATATLLRFNFRPSINLKLRLADLSWIVELLFEDLSLNVDCLRSAASYRQTDRARTT